MDAPNGHLVALICARRQRPTLYRCRRQPVADVAQRIPEKWQSVYRYFRLWCDDGTWQRIHDTLRAKVRQKAGKHKHPTAGCLDSQRVRTIAIAGIRGFDGAKLIKGRKRHVLVNTLGLLLVVVVTAASLPEREGAKLVFQRLTGACKKLGLVWLDGAGLHCSTG